MLVNPQDIFSSASSQGTILGAQASTGDGRIFRYVLAGATALVQGKLQQSQAETTGWENMAVVASAIGSNSITTTTTVTATLNQWTGGLAIISTNTGVGYTYGISGNPARTAAVITFTLSDALQVAIDATSTVSVVASPYSSVIVAPQAGSLTGLVIGAAIYPVTAAQYGWVQTAGPCGVLADDAVTVGLMVTPSDTIGGAVTTGAITSNAPQVGIAMEGIVDTDYGPIFLQLN